jgi:hypothetical protein
LATAEGGATRRGISTIIVKPVSNSRDPEHILLGCGEAASKQGERRGVGRSKEFLIVCNYSRSRRGLARDGHEMRKQLQCGTIGKLLTAL